MKFGAAPIGEALGSILAHSLKLKSGRLAKGHLLSQSDIEAAIAEGIETLIVARLENNDLGEDEAARLIANALAKDGIEREVAGTGRVNLFAASSGIFCADRRAIAAINRVSAAITLATLDDFTSVSTGRMVATVKIIPFAVDRRKISEAVDLAGDSVCLSLFEFKPKRVGLIATRLPHLKNSVMDKTRRVLEQRLEKAGASVIEELRVEHRDEAIGEAISRLAPQCEMIVVFGASAIVDRRDVIPAGLERAGGVIEHLGMPVDPGNLLMLGNLNGKPVIGAPGCARSPRENGFDWVLDRLLADIAVSADDLTDMGVGGLLMEIRSRPSPRQAKVDSPVAVDGIILAAGLSRRMGAVNKLLEPVRGQPMVRTVADAAVASELRHVIGVTGHQAEQVEQALSSLNITFAHNDDFASGLASSLKTGIGNLAENCAGAIVLLGDMPLITPAQINAMIEAFQREKGQAIIMATHRGKRGNPIIWPARFFDQIAGLSGDEGAKSIIKSNLDAVVEVEIGEAAARDFDRLEDFTL